MMTRPITSISGLFDRLGRNVAVSRMLRVSQSGVSEMKRRNSLPPKYWFRLIHEARGAGHYFLTADLLVRIHAPESDLKSPPKPEHDVFLAMNWFWSISEWAEMPGLRLEDVPEDIRRIVQDHADACPSGKEASSAALTRAIEDVVPRLHAWRREQDAQ